MWKFFEDERSNGREIFGEKPNNDDRTSSITRSIAKASCKIVLLALRDLEEANALPNIAVSVDDLMDLYHPLRLSKNFISDKLCGTAKYPTWKKSYTNRKI